MLSFETAFLNYSAVAGCTILTVRLSCGHRIAQLIGVHYLFNLLVVGLSGLIILSSRASLVGDNIVWCAVAVRGRTPGSF
jgi:hypothetical protein